MKPPAGAAPRYRRAIADGLRWMLARPALGPGWLNTKLDSRTLRNFGAEDGVKGPDFVYGWIQGRGLEALATHAAALEQRDQALAAACDDAARRLYRLLDGLVAGDGHAYFLYDARLRPARMDGTDVVEQARPPDVYTYADAFAAKGLVAAAARHAPEDVERHLAYLGRVVGAVEAGRFQLDEKAPLGANALARQPEDFGPRMILLGACGMLRRIGQGDAAGFGASFLDTVLARHMTQESGLLRTVLGADDCNPGHAIELVGFAHDDPALADRAPVLADLLATTFEAGFRGPGIALRLSCVTGEVRDPLCPWWSLPEAIRAAALVCRATKDARAARVWAQSDAAFFDRYWRAEEGIAYQTLAPCGPVDFAPATPDLDPGYHTGLSLLRAAEIAEEAERAHGSS